MEMQHDFEETQCVFGYKDGYIAIGYQNSDVIELYVMRRDGEGNPVYYWYGLRLEFCGSETKSQWEERDVKI